MGLAAANETPDQRHDRRSAIRAISRLSAGLDSSDVLSKDSGAAVLADRVAQLRQKLEGEELEVLEEQARKYEQAVGVPLPAPAAWRCAASAPAPISCCAFPRPWPRLTANLQQG